MEPACLDLHDCVQLSPSIHHATIAASPHGTPDAGQLRAPITFSEDGPPDTLPTRGGRHPQFEAETARQLVGRMTAMPASRGHPARFLVHRDRAQGVVIEIQVEVLLREGE